MADTNSSAAGTLQHVDTTEFVTTIDNAKIMAEALEDLKTTLNTYKSDLLAQWVGKGRNQFEKSYHALIQKIQDQTDTTWDVYEALVEAQEAFIQADIDAAKASYK